FSVGSVYTTYLCVVAQQLRRERKQYCCHKSCDQECHRLSFFGQRASCPGTGQQLKVSLCGSGMAAGRSSGSICRTSHLISILLSVLPNLTRAQTQLAELLYPQPMPA